MSSEVSLVVNELAHRLRTSTAVLVALKERYDERARFWKTVKLWYESPMVWVRHGDRDAKWDGIPNDDRLLLSKSPVAKATRVVMMTEAEQLARHAAGINGQGRRESWETRALKDVYPAIQELCGKVPKYDVIEGENAPAGRVAEMQKQLADWLTESEVDPATLHWLAERLW